MTSVFARPTNVQTLAEGGGGGGGGGGGDGRRKEELSSLFNKKGQAIIFSEK